MQTPEQLAATIWGDAATGSQWQKQVEARVAQLLRSTVEDCEEIAEMHDDAKAIVDGIRERYWLWLY